MRVGTLSNRSNNEVLSARAFATDGWWDRLRGWIGRPPVAGVAIGITRCDGVHTYLVSFPLDLVYCDCDGGVLRVIPALPPARIGPRVRAAETVWEMAAGVLAPRVSPGDVLVWTPGSPPGVATTEE